MTKTIFPETAKLTGAEMRTLLEKRYPGICKELADTSIETKVNLVSLGFMDIFHNEEFGKQEWETLLSPVVPSSASHRRWVVHIDKAIDRLRAFEESYARK